MNYIGQITLLMLLAAAALFDHAIFTDTKIFIALLTIIYSAYLCNLFNSRKKYLKK